MNINRLISEHRGVTRRYFLKIGAAGFASGALGRLAARGAEPDPKLAEALKKIVYLTKQADFGTVERGDPLPYTLPEDKRREVGLEQETWTLDVVADPDSNSKVEQPMSRAGGNPFTFQQLQELAEKHAVRFLKVMTCNNGESPLGIGLWEGVPLREVIWLAKPVENIRRVFYHGYHNDKPEQLFQSSLPVGRVLEDPPGTAPVILCYKLNGEWISGKRGGPVRLVVPDAYGFKSVKWLNRVVLSNLFHANDTYAGGNNDVDSWMKTYARFLSKPGRLKPDEPIPITGVCQVGISGLSRVQVWVSPQGTELPANDPYLTRGDWKDADLLPPPETWGGDFGDKPLPQPVFRFDSKTGHPEQWPLPYTIAHWATLLPGVPAGKYDLRCRTIDANGIAQPLPRPFRKSGRNSIERATLIVEA